MIYLILLLIALLCLAVMDNISSDNTFGIYFKRKYDQTHKKIYSQLRFWFDTDGWENKYQLSEWFQSLGVNKYIADYLASDVFVIFTDAWHMAKAIMMICFLIPIRDMTTPVWTNIYLWMHETYHPIITLILLFIITGGIFNFLYYKLRSINNTRK